MYNSGPTIAGGAYKQPLEESLRDKLRDEQRTVERYKECIKNYGDNKDVVTVLTEIMHDELEHVGALQALIETVCDPDDQERIEESEKNTELLLSKAAAAGGAKHPEAVAKHVQGEY